MGLLNEQVKIDFLISLCFVVLVGKTAEDAYNAFEHNAFDFMFHPLTYMRFNHSIEKVRRMRSGMMHMLEKRKRDFFFIKIDDKGIKEMMIKYVDLLYIEAMQNYVVLHTISGKNFLSYNTMKDMEENLPGHLFSRVHKSYIINDDKIKTIDGNGIILDHVSVPKILIGNKYRKGFNEKRADRIIRSNKSILRDASGYLAIFIMQSLLAIGEELSFVL